MNKGEIVLGATASASTIVKVADRASHARLRLSTSLQCDEM